MAKYSSDHIRVRMFVVTMDQRNGHKHSTLPAPKHTRTHTHTHTHTHTNANATQRHNANIRATTPHSELSTS